MPDQQPTDCSPDQYYDPDLHQCMGGGSMNPNPIPGGGTNQCPGGSHFDPASQQCVPSQPQPTNPADACRAAGNVWDNVAQACLPTGKSSGPKNDKSPIDSQYPSSFNIPLGKPPAFTPPTFSYPDFKAPLPEDIYKDPSYKWRLDQGRKALESSAAARGTLRSGGTLQGILEYGQNFGAHEFGNVFNRALQTYTTNRGTALDVFDRLYQGEKDKYAPTLLHWQMQSENARISAQRAWEDYWRRIDDQWRREHAVLTSGQN